ncbi:uracil phosphoribosyltransferase [Candidatus Kryptobacter tengchongensis]|uniref:Uracil phosphoribosyltransferase n=1 Tax=Kryptobacter tengchongensis TaxID=1643429 RepID=A0A656D1Y9_KRYT1|nr:uracil phosphoribosyltransferase [Candidatus Kryptobacter tengchongensis]CUS91879.1 uracil phosphoribosyltransferase [Candidatus Kryptobacter tengchongensis]CUS95951.1 uracil phosphoribosyltransferase [Candidatus Kryptobacter tengchongensis]CUT05924.1 uracil phosphoribosyltransferase [Candidatus Kryptobacter tengchongensis]CUU02007.1 uracil phosphoribosyltransferase [Candidatus Kryptobacter tengchongensis]CUU09380.1 uracil phosphoribosyltransferase [Candidatus Kryptobacter tengchongensis]
MGNNLLIIDHPLIKRDLTYLRDKNTPSSTFRNILRRLTSLMAFEVTKDLELLSREVETPLEVTQGHVLRDEIVLVPILRAGLGMVDAFLDLIPEARVGHIGLYRDEETLKPVDYYFKFPKNLDKSIIIILDPMLATGGSICAAVSYLKERGASRIKVVSLIAAPEGITKLTTEHPDVQIYVAVLDRQLNHKGFILPGLGDAGDRIFGTEN